MLEFIARKSLQQIPAELAHDLAIKALSSPFASLTGCAVKDNPVELMGIRFPNPVGLAAGFDKNGDAIKGIAAQGFGFIEIGTITPKPQAGNEKPRLFRLKTDQAIINRMGFNNKGIDHLVKRVKAAQFKGVLGINIGKNKNTANKDALSDYVHCFEKAHSLCNYITVNISSPNTPDLRALQNDQALTDLLGGMKAAQLNAQQETEQYTPILVKISPDQTQEQLQFMTRQIIDSGMDGIICTNTTIDRAGLQSEPSLQQQAGGLSGAPLLKSSNETLQWVRQCAGPDFPIIAVGGIMSGEDAKEKIQLGANLVQIYTGFVYHGSGLIRAINNALM